MCETQGRGSERVWKRRRKREREKEGETKGPYCLTDRQADGQELGIREYDPARESDP